MHAVTGAYAKRVFVDALGAPLVRAPRAVLVRNHNQRRNKRSIVRFLIDTDSLLQWRRRRPSTIGLNSAFTMFRVTCVYE